MPLASFGSTRVALLAVLEGFGVSATMVEVDEERLKVFANGAKCVSLSSVGHQILASNSVPPDGFYLLLVSFQDMIAVVARGGLHSGVRPSAVKAGEVKWRVGWRAAISAASKLRLRVAGRRAQRVQ